MAVPASGDLAAGDRVVLLRAGALPAEMVFLLVFVVGLAGPILTVDFEAPQAQRAVGAMAGVFFFTALAAEAFWRALDRSPTPFWARPLGTLLLLAGGAAIVYGNTHSEKLVGRALADGEVRSVHREIIAEEIVRTIVGSLGLLAGVPLTSLIAAWIARARAVASGSPGKGFRIACRAGSTSSAGCSSSAAPGWSERSSPEAVQP